MEPELAIGLPAVGAVITALLHPRPRAALVAGAVLGAAGIAAVLLAAPGLVSDQLGVSLSLSAMSRALLLAAAASLALIVAFPPPRADRSLLLTWGLAGIAGMAAIAAAPNLDDVILLTLAIALLHAAMGGRRPLAARLRAPALAVALLGAGLVFARLDGSQILARFAAIGLVAGLAAALGTLPYIHEFDPEELTATSPIAWIAFLGPILALAVITRAHELIPTAGAIFAAMLIGLGLLNVLWGGLASWLTEKGTSAWHYSFMADWGLALCAFGVLLVDGQAAAVLLLYGIVLSRLPLYLWSRQSMRESIQTDRPINLLAAAMLAGAAPFAGFAARLFLLRGATQLYWPLALVIGIGLLLWLPPSLRLGRSLGAPRGRQALGVGIALALSVAIGLYPQPILSLAGL
ncbi:MAG: hypothetical protein E6I23_11705 [Chloroflexi bacterium]|nr:MAG: hypothetical protein AUH32_04605 [Actinobacteria bacterium 13_1_40CM_66_12]TMF43074.1 MAG: hypothetical protein E6I23_11705 [Chloroflexota bacterium]